MYILGATYHNEYGPRDETLIYESIRPIELLYKSTKNRECFLLFGD